MARRAAERLELHIFDVEEGMEAEGRWPEEEWRIGVNACCFRGIRPSQSDDPTYQNVPNGNSEDSVPSVLKNNHARGGGFTQGGYNFTQSRREFRVAHLRCGRRGIG